MVRLAFAAINASADGDEEQQDGETLEAQEARVADSYMRALQLVQDNRKLDAQDAFEALLVEPLLADSTEGGGLSMASAKQLKHVILKNLAALLAEADENAMRALQLYGQALLLDDGDAVVWNRMGTLAAECGLWGAARNVFEHGLARHPRHALMLEKLVEVLLQLGDWHAASPLIDRMLHRDPGHPRAQKVSAFLEHPYEGGLNGAHEADAKALLQPRFRRRLQPEKRDQLVSQPMSHRQVSLPSATWAGLLQTLTDLIKGSSRGPENGRQLSAGETVTIQLPTEELGQNGGAEETVGERLPREASAPEGGTADAPGTPNRTKEGQQAALPDRAARVPLPRRGRLAPKVARKSTREPPHGLPAREESAQLQTAPEEVTARAPDIADEAEMPTQDRRRVSSAEGTAEVDMGMEDGGKGDAVGETAAMPKKDAHAPSRVSRRLEARREGRAGTDDEGNGGSESVNIIAMLFPFLPEPPPTATVTDSGTGGQTQGSAGAPDAPQPPAVGGNSAIRSREEGREVRAFLLARPAKESLHSLGAAAVQQLASDASRRLPPDALLKLLELAAALGSGWRPTPAVALTLAELHLDRAALCGPAAAAAAATPAEGIVAPQEGPQPAASVAVSGKGLASKRNKAAAEAAAAAHIQACEALLGAFLMDILQSPAGDASLANGDTMKLQRPLLARHQWALGRLAELRRDFAAAAKHYSACQHLCEGMETKEGDHTQQPLVILCANCERDAEISAAAASAKVEGLQLFEVLESSKRHLAEGRPGSVIAELAPALLGEVVAAARGLRSDRKIFLDALQMLQDAATSMDNASLELRCRLVALTHLLPPLPADLSDELARTAPAAGPPPPAVKETQKPVKILLTQALSELADFVAKQRRSGTGRMQALAQNTEALRSQELAEVQWRVSVLVERYYWSLCQAGAGQPLPRGAAGRSLNSKEAARQAALLAAVSALCALCELRSAARRQLSRADISAEEALMRAASGILAARRALTQQHGAWVKFCLTRLAALLQALKETPSDVGMEEEGSEGAEEVTTVEMRIESALAQCLHVLYGVDLPHRDPDWGSMEDQVVARVAMRTPEECLDAWRYIRPYAEGIADDKKALGRLQGVLQAMQKHFKAPPQAVLDAWRPDALLDSRDCDEAYLLQGPRPDAAHKLLTPPPQLQQAVAADSHAGVHAILHHLLLRLQPDLDAVHKDDIALLPDGAAAVEDFVQLACYDLRYNPLRYFAWDRIAAMYREASEGIVKMAAEELSVDEWHADRRAARATLIARQLCPAEDLVFHDEQVAMLLYERLQHAPPLYDQLSRVPERALVQRLAADAAKACERAVEGLPDEWLYHMFLGKMRAKSLCPPEQYLPDLARACALASVHAGGLVEPIYRLHATRIKLLHQPQALTPAALTLLARYCFEEEKQRKAAALMQQSVAGQGAQSIQELVNLLVTDCEAAMRWCLEKDKGFHKAHHALARSLQARGSFPEAAEELRQLFSSPKRPFYIGMWEIGDKLTKATGEVESTTADGASSALTDDDSAWGRQPPRTAGNGLEESHRKFAACRRKYLIRYLNLLARTGNFATLAAAHSFLASPQQWSNPSMMADIARLALGHCIATLAGQLRHHIPAPMAAAFQNPTGGVATTSGHILGIWAGPQSPLLGAALNSAAYSSVRHTSSMVMGVPVGQQEESRMSSAQSAVSDEALPVLEAAYGLYVEHFVLGGPEHGAKHWAAALEAAQPVDPSLAGWTGEAAFARGAFAYVDELGRRGNLDELQTRLATVRKRCKVLRTKNERVQSLAARIAAAAAAALAAALTDLERRQAAAPLPNQAPVSVPPNQAHSDVPGAGSPRRQDWAAPGAVRVAVWQPELATPGKAQPTAVSEHSLLGAATPPPQAASAARHVPSQADASAQQASLELLRHAHYLYKSGVARLPAAGSSAAGSLCRLDELLVRAYKLYRGLGQAGSALVTAEDAAAACEELARATRRSSPSGKASRAATRADRAAEGTRLPPVAEDAGREVALQQAEAASPQQAATSSGNGAAQIIEQNGQDGEQISAQKTAADSSAVGIARPATPLTRKRSRHEADVAEAVAISGAPPRAAAIPPSANGLHTATVHPEHSVAAHKPQPGAMQAAASHSAFPAFQRPIVTSGGLVHGTALTVPIRGPASWGGAWALAAPPAGAPLAAGLSNSVPVPLSMAASDMHVARPDTAAPAVKRLRPDS